MAVSLVI